MGQPRATAAAVGLGGGAFALLLVACAMPSQRAGIRPPAEAADAPAPTIAVLLPRNGYFAEAAGAIRAGLLAARSRSPGPAPRFYDSSRPQDAPTLLAQALSAGAGLIIGPLQPEAVERLAAVGEPPLRILALNRLRSDRAAPERMRQLASSPENEAAELARHALAAGDRAVLVLYPDTPWGRRLTGAFRDALTAAGGSLMAGQAYGDDPEQTLAPLLAPDGGGPYHGSADAVVLLGTRAQIGRWWPEVQRRSGGAWSGYSTSHCHTHPFDPIRDADLTGLYFVDMPEALVPQWPGPTGDLSGLDPIEGRRLAALGVDAWHLALAWQAADQADWSLDGASGVLRVDAWGRIRRSLPLARMTARGPVIVASARPSP